MKRISYLVLVAAMFLACSTDTTSGGGDDENPSGGPKDEFEEELASREFDYNAALKIAALRLTGDLPTLVEINAVSGAQGIDAQRTAYETLVKEYMDRPTFARQMLFFWRDTFKMGGTPEMDAAPALAASLAVSNGPYTALFTQATGNCPTFDAATNTFTAANCTGNAPQAGVLSNPGVMKQYFSNLGFRRVKWIQETFDCTKFPAEIGAESVDVGGPSPYTGVWEFTSISGLANGGRIDFREAKAVICANCHSTMNHQAPLFANFDVNGVYQPNIAVPTPLDGGPLAQRLDYLPDTETTAWRFGVSTPDIPSFGAAMAADPEVARCGVARVWNYALSHADIVDSLEEVPSEVIQTQVDAFIASGFKMKDLIYAVFTSEAATKF